MVRIGFDNEKYLQMQSARIKERIAQFGGKLYLEFGGKLFDDYHASRVLPGFKPDSKINMLVQVKEDVEIVLVINAGDIEKNKVRGDLGITYDMDVLRLIDAFRGYGLYVGSVVLTQFGGQESALAYERKLENLGLKVYRHYTIQGYPSNLPLIVSEDGFGKNDYIETQRSLVVVTAPGPGSGKMAVCLSQLYHDGYMEAVAVPQTTIFESAELFCRTEGILPAPESSHAIHVAIQEALKCKEQNDAKTIVFGLTGTGYFDMYAYEKFHNGKMEDYIPTEEELQASFAKIPKI